MTVRTQTITVVKCTTNKLCISPSVRSITVIPHTTHNTQHTYLSCYPSYERHVTSCRVIKSNCVVIHCVIGYSFIGCLIQSYLVINYPVIDLLIIMSSIIFSTVSASLIVTVAYITVTRVSASPIILSLVNNANFAISSVTDTCVIVLKSIVASLTVFMTMDICIIVFISIDKWIIAVITVGTSVTTFKTNHTSLTVAKATVPPCAWPRLGLLQGPLTRLSPW